MGRRPQHYVLRLRAFELFAANLRKAQIARELGLSRMTITNWSVADRWDERLSGIRKEAEKAVEHVTGDHYAQVIVALRARMTSRLAELEVLCTTGHPSTRLQAIKTWIKLASELGRTMGLPGDYGTADDHIPHLGVVDDLTGGDSKGIVDDVQVPKVPQYEDSVDQPE